MQPALAPRISQPTSHTRSKSKPTATPDMATTVPTAQDHVSSEHVLRDQFVPPPPPEPIDTMQQPPPSSPNDPHSAEQVGGSAESEGDGTSDGRKGYGKRELSTSKRAAQNRAAQRAFRQRKEGYIKKLEEQVRDYQLLSENFKAVQGENYQLRDYIINLQSRLLESQGEVPPPPSNVDGLQPGKAASHPGPLPRLSELDAPGNQPDAMQGLQHDHSRSGYPDPSYDSSAKRVKPSPTEMTPSQAALQGPSILSRSPPGTR